MRSFQDWVISYGGPEKLAVKLKMTPESVKRWTKCKGWPKVSAMKKVIELAQGQLNYEDIIESTRPRGRKK